MIGSGPRTLPNQYQSPHLTQGSSLEKPCGPIRSVILGNPLHGAYFVERNPGENVTPELSRIVFV
jgi:hypothetical protein